MSWWYELKQRVLARGWLGLWAMMAVVASGCAGSQRPTTMFRKPEALLVRYRAQRPTLNGILGEARVDQRGEQGRIRGTVWMIVAPHGQVRFDVMTQFGPVLTLTSNGDRFALLDMREKRFLEGPTCAENIGRLLRVPLTAAQVSELLLGGVPALPDVTEQHLEFKDGRYRVEQVASDGRRQQLQLSVDSKDLKKPLDEQRLYLRNVRVYAPDGKKYWEAKFEDVRKVTGAKSGPTHLPFFVQVLQPESDTDTVIRFKEIQIDPEVQPGTFEQAVPAGMTPEEALCDEP